MANGKLTQRDWAIIGLICLAILAFIYAPAIQQYLFPAAVKPPKYTTGLTVKFRIYDVVGASLVVANVEPDFWTAGADPFARTVTAKPYAVATYDSTAKLWTTSLNAGTYILTIKDTRAAGSKTYYPVKVTVTVQGTDSEDREVWLNPVQINIDTRATLTDATIAAPCYPYNSTGTYAAVSSMNTTLDASKNQTGYWFIEYTFTVSDTDEIIKSGRLYFTRTITDFIVTKVVVDGVGQTPIEDTEAADDGLTGYYVTFNDWSPGRHYVTAYVQALSPTSGTFTLNVFEYYDCLNPALRWWTLVSHSLTVTS
jgi:hypothetical protein